MKTSSLLLIALIGGASATGNVRRAVQKAVRSLEPPTIKDANLLSVDKEAEEDHELQALSSTDITTYGNNGAVSCDAYCSTGVNGEAPKGSACVKAVKGGKRQLCTSSGGRIESGALTCTCRPPVVTSGNNGHVSCDTYCSTGWNGEAPVGSTCYEAYAVNLGHEVGCNAAEPKANILACVCKVPSPIEMCHNTCAETFSDLSGVKYEAASNGVCDDVKPDEYYLVQKCAYGTDCADCGVREVTQAYEDSDVYGGYPGIPLKYKLISDRSDCDGPEWWLGTISRGDAAGCASLCHKSPHGKGSYSWPCKYFLIGGCWTYDSGIEECKCYHESTWHCDRNKLEHHNDYDLYELCHPERYGWSCRARNGCNPCKSRAGAIGR